MTDKPKDPTWSLQYSHVPCKDIQVLKDDVHDIKDLVPPDLSNVNESLIQINERMDRLFYLNRKADKRLDKNDERLEEIKIYMVKKDVTNGHTEKETEETKHEVDELNRTRQPILDAINELKIVKVDKTDFNKMDKTLTEIQTTLNDHCTYDEKLEQDRKDRKQEEEESKTKIWNNTTFRIMLLLTIIGIVIGFFQVQGGWHL